MTMLFVEFERTMKTPRIKLSNESIPTLYGVNERQRDIKKKMHIRLLPPPIDRVLMIPRNQTNFLAAT